MADYAAVPVQMVAQGLITIDAAGNPVVTGRGFSDIARGAPPAGNFILTFDQGTGVMDVGSGPGEASGIIGPLALDPRFARIAMQMRSGTTAPGTTTLSPRSATFITTPGEGAAQIQVVVVDPTDTPTDPMGAGAPNANGGGLEIVVWYGNAGPDDAQQQFVGPLFQGAMQFP